MSKIFKMLVIESVTVSLLIAMAAEGCGGDSPPPPPKPEKTKVEKTRKPAPTGCEGKITDRVVEGDQITIFYRVSPCGPDDVVSERISTEQDLNSRCTEGDYFPQCLRWYETHDPGVRPPSSPAQ